VAELALRNDAFCSDALAAAGEEAAAAAAAEEAAAAEVAAAEVVAEGGGGGAGADEREAVLAVERQLNEEVKDCLLKLEGFVTTAQALFKSHPSMRAALDAADVLQAEVQAALGFVTRVDEAKRSEATEEWPGPAGRILAALEEVCAAPREGLGWWVEKMAEAARKDAAQVADGGGGGSVRAVKAAPGAAEAAALQKVMRKLFVTDAKEQVGGGGTS
jgi:hypothetical protein